MSFLDTRRLDVECPADLQGLPQEAHQHVMAYTLNKKDSKMVCSMKRRSCSERERERGSTGGRTAVQQGPDSCLTDSGCEGPREGPEGPKTRKHSLTPDSLAPAIEPKTRKHENTRVSAGPKHENTKTRKHTPGAAASSPTRSWRRPSRLGTP